MIKPSADDLGKRVRWTGRNYGKLVAFDLDRGLGGVIFDFEVEVKEVNLAGLYWAAEELGSIIVGKQPKRHPRYAFRNQPPGRWDDDRRPADGTTATAENAGEDTEGA